MKVLLFISLFVCGFYTGTRGQAAKYIETTRDDGVVTKMYEPQVVAESGGMQIGLCLVTSTAGKYIAVILRFEKASKMLDGVLALRLSNDEMLRFNPEKIQKTNFGNLDGVIGLYILPAAHAEKLKKHPVNNVTLSFSGGALNSYAVTQNGNILLKQLN